MTREYTYIGRCKCGVIEGATIDNPERRKEVRKFVNEMMRDDLTIERVRTEELRADPEFMAPCRCGPSDTALEAAGQISALPVKELSI